MKTYLLLNIVALTSILSSCTSNNLGDNIYLLEGDRKEDRIIVECTGKSFGDCVAGRYLIPRSYEEHFNNGNYSEFVDKVKTNSDYIIATTISVNNDKKKYWIIDKKSKSLRGYKENIHFFVLGPLDFNSFLEEKRK